MLPTAIFSSLTIVFPSLFILIWCSVCYCRARKEVSLRVWTKNKSGTQNCTFFSPPTRMEARITSPNQSWSRPISVYPWTNFNESPAEEDNHPRGPRLQLCISIPPDQSCLLIVVYPSHCSLRGDSNPTIVPASQSKLSRCHTPTQRWPPILHKTHSPIHLVSSS